MVRLSVNVSFNKFKDENLLDNNPYFYLIYRQVYEDKVLTQVEKINS